MQLKRMIRGAVVAGAATALLSIPNAAHAFTSVEGAVIGDQNYYWNTPGQAWIFPHTIGNIDNRVMLQFGAPGSDAVPLLNQLPIQTANGVGIIVEMADNFNLGFWASRFVQPQLTGFVANGIGQSGQGNPAGGLAGLDAYDAAVNAGRKLDLFASYWIPDAGIEAGLHLSWGSGSTSFKLDDSVGPIDIDTDNDPATGDATTGADQSLAADGDNTFGLSDLGIGLGAAYTGLPGFRADLGLELNILSASWDQAGQSFADIGGTGIGINARAHYELNDKVTLGGFVRYARQGLNYSPERNADGQDLDTFFDPGTDTATEPSPATPGPVPAAASGDPDPANLLAGNALADTTHSQVNSNLQVTFLASYTPISRVKVYGALGFNNFSQTQTTTIGNDLWVSENETSTTALPFINVGFEGKVFDFLDIMMGTSKRWNVQTNTQRGLDTRIPNDDNYRGGGTDPTAAFGGGVGANETNARRREVINEQSANNSTTQFMLGSRLHYGPVQLVGQVDPGFLLRNVNFISGAQGNTWFWTSLIYDWDHASDINSGNGSRMGGEKTSPHDAAPAPVEAPAPAPSYESTEG